MTQRTKLRVRLKVLFQRLVRILVHQNDNVENPEIHTYENWRSKPPSQWCLSEWLHQIEECPSLLPAKTSPDRQMVEEGLRRWIADGRPYIEGRKQTPASVATENAELSHTETKRKENDNGKH